MCNNVDIWTPYAGRFNTSVLPYRGFRHTQHYKNRSYLLAMAPRPKRRRPARRHKKATPSKTNVHMVAARKKNSSVERNGLYTTVPEKRRTLAYAGVGLNKPSDHLHFHLTAGQVFVKKLKTKPLCP